MYVLLELDALLSYFSQADKIIVHAVDFISMYKVCAIIYLCLMFRFV